MATTPEGKVKKGVRQVLDKLGAYYMMPVTNGYGRQGAPDFLVCYRGKFFGIETKAGKGKLTALQELNLKRIVEAGGVALVVREEDVKHLPSLMENDDEKTNTNSKSN